jgi:hypothetical protein
MGSDSSPRPSGSTVDPVATPPPRTLSAPVPAPAPASASESVTSSQAELPDALKDAIFTRQLKQGWPLSITPTTLIEAGVCTRDKDALSVHQALLKVGVLVDTQKNTRHHHNHHLPLLFGKKKPAPELHDDQEFLPVTEKITSSLPNQVHVLSVPAIKHLIKVLFFWEQEVIRWRGKEQDMTELKNAYEKYVEELRLLDVRCEYMARAGTEDVQSDAQSDENQEQKKRLDMLIQEVQFHMRAVKLRQRVAPSRREEEEPLPKYQ